jgi:hypothetical protein
MPSRGASSMDFFDVLRREGRHSHSRINQEDGGCL